MDCVRVSTRELGGEKYAGNYIEIGTLHGFGADACRQVCVTSRECQAWEYTPDKCLTTSKLQGNYPTVVPAFPATQAGLIKCEEDWDILKLIWWIIILGLFIVLVWYVMTRCESQDR